jgi:hypothetical protein
MKQANKKEYKVWYRSEKAQDETLGLNVFTSEKFAHRKTSKHSQQEKATTHQIDLTQINIFKNDLPTIQQAPPEKPKIAFKQTLDSLAPPPKLLNLQELPKVELKHSPEVEFPQPIEEVSRALDKFIQSQKLAQDPTHDSWDNLFLFSENKQEQKVSFKLGKNPFTWRKAGFKIFLSLLLASNFALFWHQTHLSKSLNQDLEEIDARVDDIQSSIYQHSGEIGQILNGLKKNSAQNNSLAKPAARSNIVYLPNIFKIKPKVVNNSEPSNLTPDHKVYKSTSNLKKVTEPAKNDKFAAIKPAEEVSEHDYQIISNQSEHSDFETEAIQRAQNVLSPNQRQAANRRILSEPNSYEGFVSSSSSLYKKRSQEATEVQTHF